MGLLSAWDSKHKYIMAESELSPSDSISTSSLSGDRVESLIFPIISKGIIYQTIITKKFWLTLAKGSNQLCPLYVFVVVVNFFHSRLLLQNHVRDQFQPNLAHSNLGWWVFKFVQMKNHTLLRGEVIPKIIIHRQSTRPISTVPGTQLPHVINVCLKDRTLVQRGDNNDL